MEPEVLFADNHLLVLRKPACRPVVPDESGDPSLLDDGKAWIKRTAGKPGAVFLGVVHRLDRPVSGVVVFARTSKAASRLSDAFRKHEVEKLYWGVSLRTPDPPAGTMEQWLRKDGRRNHTQVVAVEAQGSKRARTSWKTLETIGGAQGRTLVELVPHSGRSHQLRVACASLGAVLAGDLKYGAAEPLADKSIGLHARSLAFDHPTQGERLTFVAEPPDLDLWRFSHAPPAGS